MRGGLLIAVVLDAHLLPQLAAVDLLNAVQQQVELSGLEELNVVRPLHRVKEAAPQGGERRQAADEQIAAATQQNHLILARL